jgi:hypothetical protein
VAPVAVLKGETEATGAAGAEATHSPVGHCENATAIAFVPVVAPAIPAPADGPGPSATGTKEPGQVPARRSA